MPGEGGPAATGVVVRRTAAHRPPTTIGPHDDSSKHAETKPPGTCCRLQPSPRRGAPLCCFDKATRRQGQQPLHVCTPRHRPEDADDPMRRRLNLAGGHDSSSRLCSMQDRCVPESLRRRRHRRLLLVIHMLSSLRCTSFMSTLFSGQSGGPKSEQAQRRATGSKLRPWPVRPVTFFFFLLFALRIFAHDDGWMARVEYPPPLPSFSQADSPRVIPRLVLPC